jgi:hypothetical protein
MKTESKISGYVLRGAAAMLLFSCVVVALSSAINLSNLDLGRALSWSA